MGRDHSTPSPIREVSTVLCLSFSEVTEVKHPIYEMV